MTSNFEELDRQTPTTHPWGRGLYMPIVAALALGLVVLVLRSIQQMGDFEGEFARVLFLEITTNLSIVASLISGLVVLAYVFAFIRRPDPASSRFASVVGRGEWLIVATFVVAALTAAITQS